jgi:hypothetical protein
MSEPFNVKGYASARHSCGRYGALLMHTWHASAASAEIELSVWQDRMKRGDVAYAELISYVDPPGVFRVDAWTDVRELMKGYR